MKRSCVERFVPVQASLASGESAAARCSYDAHWLLAANANVSEASLMPARLAS